MFTYTGKQAIRAGVAAGLATLGYPLFFRRRCLTWGATGEEASKALPGDELLPDARLVTTRAVTIAAPPDAVWPWLVQMGSGRGGAYSYDWIENLFGLDMHSSDEILSEFQHLAVGDTLPMGRGRPAMRVEVLDPRRTLAIRIADHSWVWIFALEAQNGATRLISRNRIDTTRILPEARVCYSLFMEPASLAMERKMLLGIKQRAERLYRARPVQDSGLGLGTNAPIG